MPEIKPPVILVIAGNDPSGGAGLTADQQIISLLGGHPAPVVSAVTVQDTVNAYRVESLAPELVREQAEAVLQDLPVAAVKLGLLGSAGVGKAVAALLAEYPHLPVVMDPVLVAAGGAPLAESGLLDVYWDELLPLATVLTPNADESRALVPQAADREARASAMLAAGAEYVLIKGADEDTPDVENVLYGPDGLRDAQRWERLVGHFHGSGCTLASALAALIGQGLSPREAAAKAQTVTYRALQNGWIPGKGQAIPLRIPQP